MNVEELIFELAELLRVPVLVLVLAALGLVLVEAARSPPSCCDAGGATRRAWSGGPACREALAGGDVPAAQGVLWQVAWSGAMASTWA